MEFVLNICGIHIYIYIHSCIYIHIWMHFISDRTKLILVAISLSTSFFSFYSSTPEKSVCNTDLSSFNVSAAIIHIWWDELAGLKGNLHNCWPTYCQWFSVPKIPIKVELPGMQMRHVSYLDTGILKRKSSKLYENRKEFSFIDLTEIGKCDTITKICLGHEFFTAGECIFMINNFFYCSNLSTLCIQ